ncbi:hypothetical protein SPRG_09315 [Saprolegnia parasitica CBS 223.65]|uniref:Uncharacterized protein n=1 Tax=Saprolegnia parasitica (strain CBS 223.65) TaxID=695850 RepID=A0A067C3L3_SAPPC|nr:hypothetical protein SPRG_09315 [Saprolegnia parasitica CBS 223.65]KDO25374.1 hypothetical protein SPRG_09315 [Saprolegnia parasitica CBS 223.65]|eukprot:XP_012203802.1 hypothetical protein SPRG_09315 [Saprolegnia parasitica CBS 223.65]
MNATRYPESYQASLGMTTQQYVSMVKTIFLGLSGAALGAFVLVLYGLCMKRPTWWYGILVRWLRISDPDATTSAIFQRSNAVAVHRRQSSNPLSMSLVEWRQFQEQQETPPLRGKELTPPYYPISALNSSVGTERPSSSHDSHDAAGYDAATLRSV